MNDVVTSGRFIISRLSNIDIGVSGRLSREHTHDFIVKPAFWTYLNSLIFFVTQTVKSSLQSRSESLTSRSREEGTTRSDHHGEKERPLSLEERWNHDNRPHCWPTLGKWARYGAWEASVKKEHFTPPHTLTHMKTHWLIVQSQHSLSSFSVHQQTHHEGFVPTVDSEPEHRNKQPGFEKWPQRRNYRRRSGAKR